MLEEELEKPKKEIRQLNKQWMETKAAVVEFRFTEAVDSVDAAAKVAKEVRKDTCILYDAPHNLGCASFS